MFSMFSGDTNDNGLLEPSVPFVSIGTPSITINGSLVAFKEAPPRIRIVAPPSGWPPFDVTTTPGAAPTRRSCAEVARPASISSGFKVEMAPVASSFFTVP